MKTKTFLFLLLCSQLSSSKSLLDDPCRDWEPYKDEKCFKIFYQNLMGYADAQNVCENEDGALLPIITSEEKQLFVEGLIKSQNVVDNVWIGLKYEDQSYVWADGTKAEYTHWIEGSPSNDSNLCVQIETGQNVFGYWDDIACTRRNVVICEKLQLWSLSKIQSNLMEVQTRLTKVQSTLTNVVTNPVPIGFIYVQLPKEKPPQEVWPGLEWKDVSSDYAGLFFRTEGGKSASFGEIQNESSPRLLSVKYYGTPNMSAIPTNVLVPAEGQESDHLYIGFIYGNDPSGQRSLTFQLSHDEVCPQNTAIRIWKRTS